MVSKPFLLSTVASNNTLLPCMNLIATCGVTRPYVDCASSNVQLEYLESAPRSAAQRIQADHHTFTPMITSPWISVVSSVGMAIGPPLVYADQAVSIVRKK